MRDAAAVSDATKDLTGGARPSRARGAIPRRRIRESAGSGRGARVGSGRPGLEPRPTRSSCREARRAPRLSAACPCQRRPVQRRRRRPAMRWSWGACGHDRDRVDPPAVRYCVAQGTPRVASGSITPRPELGASSYRGGTISTWASKVVQICAWPMDLEPGTTASELRAPTAVRAIVEGRHGGDGQCRNRVVGAGRR